MGVSGGAQGMFRPSGPVNPPTAGTTPPQGNRPRPASQPPGNTPAGGQPTDGQQGEPMFVQMLRTMLSGAVSSNYNLAQLFHIMQTTCFCQVQCTTQVHILHNVGLFKKALACIYVNVSFEEVYLKCTSLKQSTCAFCLSNVFLPC